MGSNVSIKIPHEMNKLFSGCFLPLARIQMTKGEGGIRPSFRYVDIQLEFGRDLDDFGDFLYPDLEKRIDKGYPPSYYYSKGKIDKNQFCFWCHSFDHTMKHIHFFVAFFSFS